jgi:hypothetical protein
MKETEFKQSGTKHNISLIIQQVAELTTQNRSYTQTQIYRHWQNETE